MIRLPRYLFVGGFREQRGSESVGGQLYACKTLMASPLATSIDFECIDSTSDDAHTSLISRTRRAGSRLIRFAYLLARSDIDGVLLFCGGGASFLEKGSMAVMAKRAGKRVVLCPRSGLILDDLERTSLVGVALPVVFRHADVVICQGESWCRTFSAYTGSGERLRVIPNWIDASVYQPKRRQRSSTKFLYLGRVEDYKGIFDLLEALSSRANHLGGVELLVAGGGGALEAARERSDALGLNDVVRFLGWVHGSEKQRVLAEADVLVLPSHREGMPNAILEAMASRLPVIATRVGGVPDILVSSELGIIVEPRDVDGLGAAMVALHRDPLLRERLGSAGCKHVTQHHDISVIWPKLYDILDAAGSKALA